MKIITEKVRFSYANVWEPKSINGSEPKYSVCIIIPKTDVETLKKVNAAIALAKKEGLSKFGAGIPYNFKTPLRDGDVDRFDDSVYAGSYFINANSNIKPGIVNKSLRPIVEQSEFYSGCYGRASIVFYAYNAEGNSGIACGLQNLQKLEEGEMLSSHSSAEEDFATGDEDFLN
ncbi:DUF2815 family protein [Clostridium tagluense]|uniref:Phage protein n=1 Tax=Clostridium tagluense TaxID=360422 RepID=A0A401UQ44_9CLOT|nr:DUF2815 family protein [Clostridium tagluense]GCD11640.1 hypothetical protein Ctaglu_32630 [Clostridium tagluense]